MEQKKKNQYYQLLMFQKNIGQLTVQLTLETLSCYVIKKPILKGTSHIHSGRLDLKSFLIKLK